jgi:uncharacterized membrane protein YphA (DoxX/SURF4 family)
MTVLSKLDQLHFRARENRWLQYFAVFNRVGLAAGFLPSGFIKIVGERFTDLSVNHPMGNYLEALHLTGYYYTFIGILQVVAAILLLIPRTVTLGALLYFPIILNICILSHAVRFEGSLLSSPLMVLANLYLLCWDYHKLKYLFPFYHTSASAVLPQKEMISNKFPTFFFTGVVATVITLVLIFRTAYNIMPRNTLLDCVSQCKDSKNPQACYDFCDCIHQKGQPLNKCLEAYNKALESNAQAPIRN